MNTNKEVKGVNWICPVCLSKAKFTEDFYNTSSCCYEDEDDYGCRGKLYCEECGFTLINEVKADYNGIDTLKDMVKKWQFMLSKRRWIWE